MTGSATAVMMRRRIACILVGGAISIAIAGCGASIARHVDVVVIVPGAGGSLAGTEQIREGLRDAAITAPIVVFEWGAPPPLFVLNLQDRTIHDSAERRLARQIAQWRQANPAGHIGIIAHSAGCGVVLGALGRLKEDAGIDSVVLLAPSVSPGYDLDAALRQVRGRMHVFYSERDRLWLHWRTGTFGTYDNVRTPAAGNSGFVTLGQLTPELRSRVFQHGYREQWNDLGHGGGHFGALSRAFVARVVAPALSGD